MSNNRFVTACALGLWCVLGANTATAAGHIVVRAGYGAPDDAQVKLAEVAEPRVVRIEAGQDPLQIVRQLCGSLTPPYLKLLSDANGAGSLAASDTSRDLTVPACFFIERGGLRQRGANESLPDFARRVIGASGPQTLGRLLKLNKALSSTSSTVQVDFATVPVLYTLRKEWSGDPAGAARHILAGYSGTLLIAADVVTSRPDDLMPMAGITARRPVPCDRQAPLAGGGGNWPFDAVELRRALARNDAFRQAHNMADGETAVVAVADNGFDQLGGTSFPRTVLALNSGEQPANNVDDDRNLLVDDFLGASLYWAGDPNPAPPMQIAYREHGTMMASLALGGPGFEFAPGRSRIRVLPISMVERRVIAVSGVGNVTTYGYPAEGLTKALLYAHRRRADVISFSVGTPMRQDGFDAYLIQPSNSVVIVAAAGNDAADFRFKPLYPANYGGRDDGFVITVGAADRRGCLADFSGRGKDRVDILAAGEAVPALGTDGQPVTVDGTSQATALVSFAVALLKSEGYSDRVAIRDRLYATADRHPSLKGLVASEGVLNIANAVSVHHDLIQETEGGPFLPGRIDGGVDMGRLCPALDGGAAKVLRVEWRAATQDMSVMFRSDQSPRSEDDCRPDAADMILRFTPEGGVTRPISWASVRVVVPR